MNKLKYILLTSILILNFSKDRLCYAQPIDTLKADSIRVALTKTKEDTSKINLLIELGRLFTVNRERDSLAMIFNEIFEISEPIQYQRGLAFGYEFLYNYHQLKNEYDEAIVNVKKAIEISEKYLEITHHANLYFSIANTYNVKGDHNLAIEFYLKSLKIYESLEDYQSYSSIYNNLGLLYQDRKEFEKAKEYYHKSLEVDDKTGDKKNLATSLNNVGGLFQELEKYDSALIYFEKAMKLYRELDFKTGLAHGYTNIGITYYYDGNSEKCMEFFLKSLEMRKVIGNKVDITQSYNNIGILYGYEDDYENAIKYSNEALRIAKEVGVKIETMDALITLYDLYYKSGKYQKSADVLFEYSDLKDSIYEENQQKSIAEMETKYDTEKKEQENQLLLSKNKVQDTQIENQKLQKYFYIAGGIAAVIILIITVYSLQQKRKDNELLTEQKYEISEKNEELNQQNEEIIAISDKIDEQNQTLSKQNTDILSSISYAKRIQMAILPSQKKLNTHLPESFVLYKPKDIVSGDFYWMEAIGNKVFWAAVDCTGHGVPGAFMSIVGANGLKKIVLDNNIFKPSEILTQLTEHVIDSVADSKDGRDIMDGMDIALCCWDKNTNIVEFAGAYNPLYIIRHKEEQNQSLEIEITKATKRPIGRYLSKKVKLFENHSVQMQKGDIIYTFTDGYADQFGGVKGGKFSYNRFKEQLLTVHSLPMNEQLQHLEISFENWRGSEKQLDDVCVMGVRI